MKVSASIIFTITLIISFQAANAAFYECTYKNNNGIKLVSSFNPNQKYREDYDLLYGALISGNCKELYIKKYLINATSCNIQFYKYNGQIANLSCKGNNPETMQKLRDIAAKEFGYYK